MLFSVDNIEACIWESLLKRHRWANQPSLDGQGEDMTSTESAHIPEVTLGDEEPSMSSLGLAFSLIVAVVFLLFFSVVFSWEALPALGSFASVFNTLTEDSGIWWYLIGIIGGGAMILMTWVGEVFRA